MKRLLAISAITAFGLAPAIGNACEYNDAATSASVEPPALASAPAPQASKVPAPAAKEVKVVPAKLTKPAADKAKSPAPDDKIATLSRN